MPRRLPRVEWASEQESLEEWRSGTFPGPPPIPTDEEEDDGDDDS